MRPSGLYGVILDYIFLLQFGKSMWDVKTGRKDGKISRDTEALANLPSPLSSFSTLKQRFSSKGLSVRDLVVLSG